MELGPKQNVLINEMITLFSSIGVFKKFQWAFDKDVGKIRVFAIPAVIYKDMTKDMSLQEIEDFSYSCILPDEDTLSDMAMMRVKYYDILSSLLNAYISGNGDRLQYNGNTDVVKKRKVKPTPPPSIGRKDGKVIK